jgi:hypothetical protein
LRFLTSIYLSFPVVATIMASRTNGPQGFHLSDVTKLDPELQVFPVTSFWIRRNLLRMATDVVKRQILLRRGTVLVHATKMIPPKNPQHE